jgi:Ca2+-binding EF-hand superfamily protein
MKNAILLAAAFMLMPATAAMAAAKVSPLDAAFARYDKNKDGFVTKAEIPPGHDLLDHFDMADKDRDGKLSKREFGIALKML